MPQIPAARCRATLLLLAGLGLAGVLSAPAAARNPPAAAAADPPAPGSAIAGEAPWRAGGLCAPAEVSPALLLQVFAPLAPGPEGGAGRPSAALGDRWTAVLGPYLVRLDPAARAASVSGPEGAAVLARDIEACLGGRQPLAWITTAGAWRWSPADGAWRYVDETLAPPPPAAES